MAYSIEIKDFDKQNANFSFYQSGEENKKSSDSGELLKFVHDMQMYKPNSLEIELYLTNKNVTISSLNGQLITLYEDSVVVAKDYFIFNVRKKGSYVTLKAYSADYFLTLDKFCQAFTAKKLVEGIINPTLAKCSSNNFVNFRKIAGSSVQGELKHFLKGHQLPYAVQYNESFYDFMVRICNRNGEFLYSDVNNKLTVGLAGNTGTLPSIEDADIEYENAYVETQECCWVDRNYLEGSGSELTKAEDGNETLKCYSAYGVYAPEYLEKIQGEKFCNWNDYTCAFTEIFSVLHACADERTIYDASLAFIKTVATNDTMYGYWVNKKNKIYKTTYPDKTELYSTISTETNINDTYLEIDENQRKAQSNQVRLFFSANPKVNLGDEVAYSGVNYVVYEIHNNTYKDNSSYTNEYELLLVGKTESGFYPLPMPEKSIRKTSAQRAKVVDNFDPDRLGRVRVMYPWQPSYEDDQKYWEEIKREQGKTDDDIKEMIDDEVDKKAINEALRNEINNRKNCSPWIRVSVPMASDGAGFFFTPAVGDEVLIDYEDGNIERPYVSGAFYNVDRKPSVPAQTHNYDKVSSITSANGHHISFTDNGGSERFYFDFLPIIKMANTFGVHDNIIPGDKFFGGGFEISDYYGVYAIKGSTHGRSVDISSPFGTVSIDALTGISINAPLGDVKIVGKNVSIEARNNLTIESGTNVKGYLDGINRGNWKQKLWENLGEKVLSDIVDISHYRHIIEIFLRPIGGTMLLKSNRYMRLEAGEGKTVIDDTNDYDASLKDKAAGFFLMKPYPSAEKVDIYAVKTRMVRFMNDYKVLKDMILSTQTIVKDWNHDQVGGPIINGMIQNHEVVNNLDLSNVEDILLKQNLLKIWRNTKWIRQTVTTYQFDEYKTKDRLQHLFNTLWNLFENLMCSNANIRFIEDINKKDLMYKEFEEVVKDNKNNDVSFEGRVNENNINTLNLNNHIKKKSDVKSDVKSSIKQVLGTISGFEGFVDDKCWSTKDKGAILFSDNENNYFKISNEGSFIKADTTDEAKQIIDIINSIGNDPL